MGPRDLPPVLVAIEEMCTGDWYLPALSRLNGGDPVPDFEMTADDGGIVSSGQWRGRYVLYFYPKDDTPGCTTQACGCATPGRAWPRPASRSSASAPDTTSHVKFREKYALPYRLLSDSGHAVGEAFGVWIEKSYAGRTYYGASDDVRHRPGWARRDRAPAGKAGRMSTSLLEALAA